MSGPKVSAVREIRSGWKGAVLVCGKCSRRIDGGFGPDGTTPLAKLLRKAFGLTKGKGKRRRDNAGIVEVGCVGLCPKRAVAVIDAARPDRWLVVAAGSSVDEIAAKLPALLPMPDPAPGTVFGQA